MGEPSFGAALSLRAARIVTQRPRPVDDDVTPVALLPGNEPIDWSKKALAYEQSFLSAWVWFVGASVLLVGYYVISLSWLWIGESKNINIVALMAWMACCYVVSIALFFVRCGVQRRNIDRQLQQMGYPKNSAHAAMRSLAAASVRSDVSIRILPPCQQLEVTEIWDLTQPPRKRLGRAITSVGFPGLSKPWRSESPNGISWETDARAFNRQMQLFLVWIGVIAFSFLMPLWWLLALVFPNSWRAIGVTLGYSAFTLSVIMFGGLIWSITRMFVIYWRIDSYLHLLGYARFSTHHILRIIEDVNTNGVRPVRSLPPREELALTPVWDEDAPERVQLARAIQAIGFPDLRRPWTADLDQ